MISIFAVNLRMRRILNLCWLIALVNMVMFTGSAYAQQFDIRFHTYTLKDGLSQSTINTVFQDEKGFMWIGTQDGLNRFDGYEFKVFSHSLGDSSTISSGFVRDILQLPNDRILLATEKGLNVMDQRTEHFIHYKHDEENQNAIDHDNIYALHKDLDGNIWIGTEKGLNLFDYKKGVFIHHKFMIDGHYMGNAHIRDIKSDKSGLLWIATEGHGLLHYNPRTKEIKKRWGRDKVRSDRVWSVQIIDNEVWIGTTQGLTILDPTTYTPQSSYQNVLRVLHNKEVRSIFKDSSGNIWIGTFEDGLVRFNKAIDQVDIFKKKLNSPTSLNDNIIYAIYEDTFGNIWIGTNNGISRFDKLKQYFHHYKKTTESGLSLSHNNVWSILEANDGRLYIGTNRGMDIVDRKRNTSGHIPLKLLANDRNQSSSGNVLYLFQDTKGRLLAGTDVGLLVADLATNTFRKFPLNNESINDSRVYFITEDSRGLIWCGTRNGLLIIDEKDGIERRFNSTDSIDGLLSGDIVRVIEEGPQGYMWIGGDALNLCRVKWDPMNPDKLGLKVYKANAEKPSALSNSSILSMHADKEGNLWIGTFGGGLNKFEVSTEKFERFTEKEGLANNVIYGILEDNSNKLWMSTNKGLSRFDKTRRDFLNFEENDGLQSDEFNIGAYCKSKSGELFFGGINGFNSFYPDEIKINTVPPKMLVTNFYLFNKEAKTAGGKEINSGITYLNKLQLDYQENVVTFEIAALHYSAPEKNKHAYKLEGFDQEWVYIGNNRRANYTNLDPGVYTFKIKGANSDGVWSEEKSMLTLTVLPPFYKTWKFRIGLFIVVAIAIYYFYKSRLRRIQEQKELLEIQVKERTYEVMEQKEEIERQKSLLEAEKDKVEKLLHNILPEETVEELKIRGKARARSYRMISVMFADFEGFTRISENMKPQELVAELDQYFVKFDEIIEKFNIEKIKTMGDAYMCAGGLPIRNKSNPIEITLAGLEIQRYIDEANKTKEQPWNLRLGIHTGGLVAGVVGIKRFAYDIWGDTVNVASRMESSGEVGKVNVSGTTYEHIREFFKCEYRGKIKAKNKGEIDMYFVHGIKPELSKNGEGIEPNDLFWKYVDLYLYSSINYRKAEKFIIKKLEKELPVDLHYHSIDHTKDVCDAIERIALMEGLVGEDVFLLKTAALYHDAGFVKQYESNEPIGAELAEEALGKFGYTAAQIETVKKLILATKVPQQPKGHLEEIICDADLDYLGRDDFHVIADKLKQELLERDKIKTDKEWDEIQVKFLTAHKYFTKSAIKMRREKKMANLEEIKERLKTYK